jgi:hypothetical protein
MFYLTTLSTGNYILTASVAEDNIPVLSTGSMVLAKENPKYSGRNISQETEVLL